MPYSNKYLLLNSYLKKLNNGNTIKKKKVYGKSCFFTANKNYEHLYNIMN